jgi:hypothetical protein
MTCRNTHFQKETENLTCDRNVTLTKRGNIIGIDFYSIKMKVQLLFLHSIDI